jgi:hypothetical protein
MAERPTPEFSAAMEYDGGVAETPVLLIEE